MTSPGGRAGRAFVEILGDTRKFAAQLTRDLGRALRDTKVDMQPVGEQIEKGIEKGVAGAADALDKLDRAAADTADEIGDDFERSGERAEDALEEVGDKAKHEFDRVEKDAKTAGSNIGRTFKLAAGAFVAAFAAVQIGQFFASATTSAEDLGSAIENTQQIIQSTGGAAGFLADEIRDLSKALSLRIGVDSVEVQNAANVLLTFKNVTRETFFEALSLSADLAAVLQTDLQGAVLQVGKALNDPIRGVTALSRAGVQFTEQQRDQIKALVESGNILGAQAIILGELESQVGGVAAAGVDTTDQLAVAFQDLKRAAGQPIIELIDEIGPALLNFAESLVPVFSQVGGVVADTLEALLPAILPILTNLGNALSGLAPSLLPLGVALGQLLASVAPLAVPLGEMVGALATGLLPVLRALNPLISGAAVLLGGLFSSLAPVLVTLGQTIADVLTPIAGTLGFLLASLTPIIEQLVSTLAAALQPQFDAAVVVVTQLWTALTPLIPTILQLIPPVLEVVVALTPLIVLLAQLITLAAQIATPIIQLAVALVGLLANEAVVPLIELLAEALTLVLKPVEALVPLIEDLTEFIGNIDWGATGKAIGDAFGSALDDVVDFFEMIGEFFANLPDQIGDFLSSLPQRIADFFGRVFDEALRAIGRGIGLVVALFVSFPDVIMFAVTDLPRMLGEFFVGLWNQARDFTVTGLNNIFEFLTSIPNRIVGILNALPGLVSGIFRAIFDRAGQAVLGGIARIVSFIQGLPGRITAFRKFLVDAGASLIGGLISGLERVGGFVGDLAARIVDSIKGFLNRVIDSINRGIGDIDDALPFDLPRIPRLARGGLTTREGLAALHAKEMVLPLEDSRATDLLARAMADADAQLRAMGTPTFQQGDIEVRVFIGDRELTDIVDVQISEHDRDVKRRVGVRRR